MLEEMVLRLSGEVRQLLEPVYATSGFVTSEVLHFSAQLLKTSFYISAAHARYAVCNMHFDNVNDILSSPYASLGNKGVHIMIY